MERQSRAKSMLRSCVWSIKWVHFSIKKSALFFHRKLRIRLIQFSTKSYSLHFFSWLVPSLLVMANFVTSIHLFLQLFLRIIFSFQVFSQAVELMIEPGRACWFTRFKWCFTSLFGSSFDLACAQIATWAYKRHWFRSKAIGHREAVTLSHRHTSAHFTWQWFLSVYANLSKRCVEN